jgi:hypothetical protein
MPVILRQLPFSDRPSTSVVGGALVAVRPFQIVVWVSLTDQQATELPANTPKFPAILDPGFSHNFAIPSRHLYAWTGIPAQTLPVLQRARINRTPVLMYAADVWVHPNRPGERDRFTPARPLRLNMAGGIAVYPPDTPGEPRLPLLGLRALALNNLHLTIDGQNRRVTLRTARRLWPF